MWKDGERNLDAWTTTDSWYRRTGRGDAGRSADVGTVVSLGLVGALALALIAGRNLQRRA
jgi:hypothetical protein